MAAAAAAQSALLKWANTFPIGGSVRSLADLSDGVVLSKILADIDPSFSLSALNKPNILQVFVNGLSRYIQIECDDVEGLLEAPVFKAIPKVADGQTLVEVAFSMTAGPVSSVDIRIQLLTVLLMAAISGPERATYVTIITELDGGVKAEIAGIIQAKQKEVADAARGLSSKTHDAPPSETQESNDLELEIYYASILTEKKNLEMEKQRLKKEVADMTARLGRLQENNDLLQSRLIKAEDQLTGATADGETAKRIKGLEAKIQEQDELIANQEGQVEQDRTEKLRLRKELDRLTASSELVIKLQDELKEAQFQNVELAKKANTMERYKQKLEAQRDFQTENKILQQELDELKARSRDHDTLIQRNASLEATHKQFQSTLEKREIEIFEMSNQKRLLDDEKAHLRRQIAVLEERKLLDDNFITDLQDQVTRQSPGWSQSGSSPSVAKQSSLEDELANSDNTSPRNLLEITRLKAENQLLKGNAAAAQENNSLRIQLEENLKTQKLLEAKYQEAFEKQIIAEQQMTAMLDASTTDGSVKLVEAALSIASSLTLLTPEYYSDVAFVNLRKAHQTTTEQLTAVTKKSEETEAHLESVRRDLLNARADLSMIEKDEMDALEELKATQESLAFSFENELKALQNRHKLLQIDHDLQKSQLIEALLSKDKLRESVTNKGEAARPAEETGKSLNDSKLVEAQEVGGDRSIHGSNSHLPTIYEGYWDFDPYQSQRFTSLVPAFSTIEDAAGREALEAAELSTEREALEAAELAAELAPFGLAPADPSNPAVISPPHALPLPYSPAFFPASLGRQRLHSTMPKVESRDKIINELQARIKILEIGGIDEKKSLLEKENINLKREQAMMITAWYDLSSRLQSNTVVLHRRADASKSWINKQRHSINPTGRR